MPRTKQESQRLIEALENAGFDTRSYSGRGMYGKSCVAVSGEDVSGWNIAKALWYDVEAEDHLDLPEPKQDSMGLGIVLYWPSYEWPEDEEDES